MPITAPTVFVLGAGASRPYNFPLGRELVDQVCRALRGAPVEILRQLGHEEDEIEQLLTGLQRSASPSVDFFLEHHIWLSTIGKRIMAFLLLDCEQERNLFPPGAPSPHWYEYLANRLGQYSEDWRDNRLTVVTFNYDRSLEQYLSEVYAYRRGEEGRSELADLVPIIHVHGSLGSGPYGAPVTPERIAAAADAMRIVVEATPDDASFAAARAALRSAERIYFLGFGFHPENVSRLQLFDDAGVPTFSARVLGGTTNGIPRARWREMEQQLFHGRWTGPQAISSVGLFLPEHAELD